MLTNKTFLRKTRRGKVVKVVREHYLRDDLPCGSQSCPLECKSLYDAENAFQTRNVLLSPDPASKTSLFPFNHYTILDTNIVLNEIDLIEDPQGLENVVILQTVLAEVRHRSSPIYKRLKDVLEDKNRKFHLFINEHHKDCYLEQLPGEVANDYKDRLIRQATQWYQKHLSPQNIQAVLITNDVANRKLAQEIGLQAVSLKSYVEKFTNKSAGNPCSSSTKGPSLTSSIFSASLMDRLSSTSVTNENIESKKELFPLHLTNAEINAGIKGGKLMQGTFFLSNTNYKEGNVSCDGYDKPVLIQGLYDQNRAVNGDTVAIRLLDEKEWSVPSNIVAEQDQGVADGGDVLEDEELPQIRDKTKLQPTGRVVGIIRRKWRQYCGMLVPSALKGATRHIFVPAEKKIPKVRIETRQADHLKGKRIVVAVDSWPRHSRYPLGHFVRVLGPIGDKATENEVLLLEHDIPHSSFSNAVLDCLPDQPWTITDKDREARLDFRDLDVCSVDPPGCTDIDDALHSRELATGNWEVGVHIADVAHFVRPHTAMDKEAANRSTTVYLTDRRIDMLPVLLSSNLCSLRGGEERLAFSCVWEIEPDTANIVKTKFAKSIIRSKKAMTYEEAQNKIDDEKDQESVTQSLRRLMKLSKILKQRRIEKGALQLASSEVRFTVDSETADPIDVQQKQVRDTNSMVEEFMLAANISAAEHIFETFPDCSMLRRHPVPPPSNFEPLVLAGKNAGFEIKLESGKALAESLNEAEDPKNPFYNTMLRMIATRCMMQAVYFASGTIEEPLFAHYGLACNIYTHFTSPIRRYADIIVHRLLAASIGADVTYPALLDKKQTQNIANNINYRHRMAQYASRASVNLHTHMFFKNQPRDEVGYVLMIKQNAIQVLIPKYGLEGTLYLKDSGFSYDSEAPSQTSKGVTLKLFEKVVVRISLDDSNVQHEKLVLKLVKPVIDGFSVDPVESKARKRPSEASEGVVVTKKIRK